MLLGIPKRTLIITAVLAGVLFIYILGDERGGVGDIDVGGSAESGCQFTVTADVLNVRSGPSTDADVVDKVTRDETVAASSTVRKGFRKLGDERWVAKEFLTPLPDATCG
ncbi:SH3 domain-containing protein [Haloechinothrix salitolerans]|uniref:SH3 domain-containing protein n=1 Tax=Haloechinothrix salitolerans TaxID=926830 RepID=A0ABW2CB11_9PSEU